jgi:very-short-patch-repair endonuclease
MIGMIHLEMHVCHPIICHPHDGQSPVRNPIAQKPDTSQKKLWGALRKRSLGGHRFVRQAQIGNYIADFLCREKAFIIEVDGATHSSEDEVAYDAKRTRYLESLGFMVHRIDNIDVYKNLNDSLTGILAKLDQRPSLYQPKNPLSPSDSSPSKLVERER